MDDDLAEMARLRQTKRYKKFEEAFHRNGARINQNDSDNKHIQTRSTIQSKKRKFEEMSIDKNVNNNNDEDNDEDNNDDTDDMLQITHEELQSLPTSFGKKNVSSPNNKQKDKNKNKIDFVEQFKSDDEDKEDVNNDTEDKSNMNKNNNGNKKLCSSYLKYVLSEYSIPMKYCAKLKGHNKLISTMDLDRSGTRLITGSYDTKILFWDFGGMNESLLSFRTIIPQNGYPIRSLKYNYSGSMFLCCTTSSTPIVYDRDGKIVADNFKKGDMYISDMNHTFGHTMPIMGGKWFGSDYLHCNTNKICTWSQDSTFRIWDINNNTDGKCSQIIKSRNKNGKRVHIMSADFSNNAHCNSLLIAFGCNDGSIQLFDHKSHCKRPKKILYSAHVSGTDISCIKFDTSNTNHFLSRGGMNDNTLKIWDIRNLSNGAIKVFNNMYNITSLSNIIQSPQSLLSNNKSITKSSYITLCSNDNDSKIGKSSICIIDKKNLCEVIRVPISDKSINCLLWNKKINQLFVGGNDSNIRCYYDDKPISKNGILLCAKRKMKKKHIDEQVKYFKIINPNALRVYKKHSQILREKMKADLLLHKPIGPHYGVGVGGRINTESFTANVYKSIEKNVMSQVDPRDRLLLFDEKSKLNQHFTQIYNINQPKAIYEKTKNNDNNQDEDDHHTLTSKAYKQMTGGREYKYKNDNDDKTFIKQQPPNKKQKLS